MRLKRMELDLVTGEANGIKTLFGGRKIPRRELINFCFHLEQLTRAGVPILEGLTTCAIRSRTRAFAKSSPA
jgi:type IV pilus assembly protein PilC